MSWTKVGIVTEAFMAKLTVREAIMKLTIVVPLSGNGETVGLPRAIPLPEDFSWSERNTHTTMSETYVQAPAKRDIFDRRGNERMREMRKHGITARTLRAIFLQAGVQ